jgi:hypothetical protein
MHALATRTPTTNKAMAHASVYWHCAKLDSTVFNGSDKIGAPHTTLAVFPLPSPSQTINE